MTEQHTAFEVSVIVVNLNRAELLRASLKSLSLQTGVHFQVIVVDNGSSDSTIKMLQTDFPQIQVLRNHTNLGFCAANNQGIRASEGRFVALLNNDAEADPSWLAELRSAFEQDDVGMAASKILIYSDPRRIDKAGHLIYPDGQNRGRGTGAFDDGAFDREQEVLWPDGCAAMYRRSMLDQIGLFDEDLFAYGDDAELGLRARIAGWRCLYKPRAVVRHHRGSTLGVASMKRLALIERNRVLLAVKLFPLSLLAVNPFYYALRLAGGAVASASGRGETSLYPGLAGKIRIALALLWGDLRALVMIPRTLRKRAGLRGIRKLSSCETRSLILSHSISLTELSTQAAAK